MPIDDFHGPDLICHIACGWRDGRIYRMGEHSPDESLESPAGPYRQSGPVGLERFGSTGDEVTVNQGVTPFVVIT